MVQEEPIFSVAGAIGQLFVSENPIPAPTILEILRGACPSFVSVKVWGALEVPMICKGKLKP
jgi:hypothetical protein